MIKYRPTTFLPLLLSYLLLGVIPSQGTFENNNKNHRSLVTNNANDRSSDDDIFSDDDISSNNNRFENCWGKIYLIEELNAQAENDSLLIDGFF